MNRADGSGDAREPEEPQRIEETRKLVLLAREGGARPFQDLYDRVAPLLYAWTRLRLHGSNADAMEVDDFLQEVWLRACEAFPRYQPERATFRAWILGIAKNVLLEVLRRREPAPIRPIDTGSADGASRGLESIPDAMTSVRTRLARDDLVQRFLAEAERLDPIDRRLLLHVAFEGFTCVEAATRLGLSPDAATKRWQRLRARLREGGFVAALELDEGG